MARNIASAQSLKYVTGHRGNYVVRASAAVPHNEIVCSFSDASPVFTPAGTWDVPTLRSLIRVLEAELARAIHEAR